MHGAHWLSVSNVICAALICEWDLLYLLVQTLICIYQGVGRRIVLATQSAQEGNKHGEKGEEERRAAAVRFHGTLPQAGRC